MHKESSSPTLHAYGLSRDRHVLYFSPITFPCNGFSPAEPTYISLKFLTVVAFIYTSVIFHSGCLILFPSTNTGNWLDMLPYSGLCVNVQS